MAGSRWAVVLLAGSMVACENFAPQLTTPSTPFVWQLPADIPAPRELPDNPMTYEKIDLGRHLFYDKRLSGNRTFSCATCHHQSHAFADDPDSDDGSADFSKSGAERIAVAWSAWLAEGTWLTASLLYARRLAAENYKIGDSVEGGFSLQRRWGSRDEANFSVFIEVAARHLWPAVSFSQSITNTGGTMCFLSPGFVFAWPEGFSVSTFFQLPVLRYANEPQQYLEYRGGVTLAYVFGL